jgi:Domain of unknown function (DUF5615)
MAIQLYMDVHVPQSMTVQLRRRNVDVLTAQEDDTIKFSDEQLLERTTAPNHVLFTQDIRFRARAGDWQRQDKPFAGLIFGHQLGGTIGQFVQDLELIAKASEPEDWFNRIEYIPY